MKTFSLAVAGWLVAGCLFAARPLTESTFTQVINDVKVLPEASKIPTLAKVNGLFKTPDLLRTGADSLAELMAADQTITRVGANTVFSFEANGRNINLEQGSVLFHSPRGKGGGTIKTRAASAAVLGTTIIVVATANGGFKAILLEGRGQIRLPNGNYRVLKAGQLTFVLPGAERFGPVLEVNLDKLVKGSRLVKGFTAQLPSIRKIEVEIEHQGKEMERGHREDTGMLVGDHATENEVEVVDSGVLEKAVEQEEDKQPLSTTPQAVLDALNQDAIINSSTLDPNKVFTDEFTVELRGVTSTHRGFVGRDITINSSQVDLTPYTTGEFPKFGILASKKIFIPNSVTFRGALPPGTPFGFTLTAAEGFDIGVDISLNADQVGDFSLHSGDTLDLDTVSMENLSGYGVELSTVTDSGQVFGDINLNTVTLRGSPIEIHGRKVNIENSVLELNSETTGSFIEVKAESDLFIKSSTIDGFTSTSSSAMLKALNTMDLANVTFSGQATISLYARTVNLENVNFPAASQVTIGSQYGMLAPNPNTHQASVPGYVNFIANVVHGGSPAQFQVSTAQGGAATGAAAITIVTTP